MAHLVELVTEEFEAHGGGGGGREDVDDAAAHRVLAALGDQIHAGVGGIVQAAHHVLEGVFLAADQVHGFELFDAGDDGLDDGAHGGDHDAGAARGGPGDGS